MKVSEAIKMLTQNYKQDDDLFIAWWDKDSADDYTNDEKLSNDEWESIVKELDEDEHLFYSVSNTISELVTEIELERDAQ